MFFKILKIIRIVLGAIIFVLGFILLITPFTPGSWLIFVGLQILGIKIIFLDKLVKLKFANTRLVYLALLLILVLLTLFIFLSLNHQTRNKLVFNGLEKVEVADSPGELQRGLSGRAGLASGEGMFFIFPKKDFNGIWMKNMLFPIDILWLDDDYKIIFIKENVSPRTFPEIFYPPAPAKYVLEIGAGQAEKLGWREGIILSDLHTN